MFTAVILEIIPKNNETCCSETKHWHPHCSVGSTMIFSRFSWKRVDPFALEFQMQEVSANRFLKPINDPSFSWKSRHCFMLDPPNPESSKQVKFIPPLKLKSRYLDTQNRKEIHFSTHLFWISIHSNFGVCMHSESPSTSSTLRAPASRLWPLKHWSSSVNCVCVPSLKLPISNLKINSVGKMDFLLGPALFSGANC